MLGYFLRRSARSMPNLTRSNHFINLLQRLLVCERGSDDIREALSERFSCEADARGGHGARGRQRSNLGASHVLLSPLAAQLSCGYLGTTVYIVHTPRGPP